MLSSDKSSSEPPFILPDSGSRTAWLSNADTLITKGMGGILAERQNTVTGLADVLDLGCGSGGWVMEIARCTSAITATGVDINERMINFATMNAQGQGLDNAHFQFMDIQQPFTFPDATFDLVNARTLFSSLTPTDWPPLVQECLRILRPGGILRLTELERTTTNSPAIERFWDLYARALFITGRSFSPDGRYIGIVPHLGRLLHQAGFQNIANQVHTPDLSSWAPGHRAWQEHTLITQTLLEPFLVKSGVTTSEDLARLREQEQLDMLSPDFSGLAFFFTTWGEKCTDI
jgi:ubiquinone/menaquinone biosynthesis C-methylase UbiE